MSFKRLLTVGLMALFCAGTATAASQLNAVQVTTAANSATIDLRTTGSYAHKEYRPDGHLLLVDLTGVTADESALRSATLKSDVLKSYRLSTYTSASGSQVTRLELTLAEGVAAKVTDESYGLKIQLTGGPAMPASSAPGPLPSASAASSAPSPIATSANSAAASKPMPAASPNTPAHPLPATATPVAHNNAPAPQIAQPAAPVAHAVLPPAHLAEPKAAGSSSAPATIRSISVSREQGTLDIVIEGPSSARPFLLKDPDRLVLDFPNTVLKPSVKNIAVHTREVREVRVGRFQSAPPVARIVIDLSGPFAYDVVPSDHRVTVRVKIGEPVVPVSRATAPPSSELHIVQAEPSAPAFASRNPHAAPPSASVAPVAPASKPTAVAAASAVTVKPAATPVVTPAAASVVTPVVTSVSAGPAPALAPAPVAPKAQSVTTAAVTPKPAPPAVETARVSSPTPVPAAAPLVVQAAKPTVAATPVVTTAPIPTVAAAPIAPVVAAPVAVTPAVTAPPATVPKAPAEIAPAALPKPGQPIVADTRALPPSMQQSSAAGAPPPPPPTSKYTGEPISVNLKDVDLKDFFRLIHEISGLNVVLDPSVKGSVTLVLDDVPWDQALDIVLKNNVLDRELQGNVLRIAAADTLRKEAVERRAQSEAIALAVDRQTVTRLLSYAKAKELVPTVKKFLTARGDVISDDRTNALIISDIPSVLPTLDRLITQLDRKSQQVEIEVRVVSATRSFSRDLGFQLGFNWGNGVSTIGGSNPNGSTLSSSSSSTSSSVPLFSNYPATGATTGLSFSNITKSYGLEAILTAAESHNLAKVLSRPRVVTQSNVKAEIKQGVKLPITTASTQNSLASTSYIDSVLRLSVTPQITADNTIFMTVDVENTQPEGTANSNGNYILTTQQTTTQVLVSDGGTVVIGGVIQTTNSVSTTQTPFLGNIPWLGNLFKERLVKTETDELIFFITPKIIQG